MPKRLLSIRTKPPNFTNTVPSLRWFPLLHQVATLEMKELNESQRASHAESQMKLIQEQLRQLESRNEELETKFADVTKANLELQVAERELRDQIVTSVSKDEVCKMEKKIEVCTQTIGSFFPRLLV